jgi:hypothetical protein
MRHRQRHVHATILKHVKDTLTTLGWVNSPVNFGTTPVSFLDYEPLEAGETPDLNTVAVSMGDQGADEAYELGGGLVRVDYTVFCDVWGANIPIGVAIAEDIKDALTEKVIALRDFTTNAAGVATSDSLEFEMVVVEVIPTATTTLDKRTWRSVKATAVCYYAD